MKSRNILNIILFGLSIIGFGYAVFTYQFFQRVLTPKFGEPTNQIITLGNFVILCLVIFGVYHLFLLFQTIKTLPMITKTSFASIYLVFLILSGITLLSDATLLSEIGKEYLFWDVTNQWYMLFGFTVFHILIMIIGFGLVLKAPHSDMKFFESFKTEQDIWFIALNQIGVVCGLLGFAAFFLALFIQIPERFRDVLLILFSTLAAVPWGAFVIYWLVKNRNTKPAKWLDEKQTLDSAYAAFITLLISMPVIVILIFITGANLLPISPPFWIALIFFIQLSFFSIFILRRS